jgi:hypothetical protein
MCEILKHDITSNILIHHFMTKKSIIFMLFYFLIDAFMYISRHPFNIELLFRFSYIYKNSVNSNKILNILIYVKSYILVVVVIM